MLWDIFGAVPSRKQMSDAEALYAVKYPRKTNVVSLVDSLESPKLKTMRTSLSTPQLYRCNLHLVILRFVDTDTRNNGVHRWSACQTRHRLIHFIS